MSNPDSPVKQLYDLLHQYIPEHSLPRAIACLQQIGESDGGNWAPMLRAWRDATGCWTPFDAKRLIAEIRTHSRRKP